MRKAPNMAIEAPVSKYKKTNLKIYIAVCIGLVIWCVYDGYFNEKFKEKYTDPDGKAKGWLVVNRSAPPYLIGAAVLLSVYLFAIRNKKIVADENELIIPSTLLRTGSGKENIPYEAIQKIDKTYFDKKGFFIITYSHKNGSEVNRKLSDRKYDNLAAILDHLVAKIT
ncbi:MAG: hypothetical protein ACE5NM_06470 [Sedimentisphaerales bacterium]